MLPDHNNQAPSDMAHFNEFPHLERELRHAEDVLFNVPVPHRPSFVSAKPAKARRRKGNRKKKANADTGSTINLT